MKVILFLFYSSLLFSQKLHRQTLSAQGKTAIATNGIKVSQSIAQLSSIGTTTREKIIVSQGFQQSNVSVTAKNTTPTSITTTVYPNPFIDVVYFKFTEAVDGPISISVFDMQGRLILFQEKEAIENLLTIPNLLLAAGKYLVKLKSKKYSFSTIILKSK